MSGSPEYLPSLRWWVACACLLIGCGETVPESDPIDSTENQTRRFEGTEVKFTEDGTDRHFLSETAQLYHYSSSEGSGRNEVSVDGPDGEDTLRFGVASTEFGTYTGDNANVSLTKQVDYEDVRYVEDPVLNGSCPDDTQIEIEEETYGLLLGSFSATLCKDFEDEPGPSRISVSGEFATTPDR